MRRFRKLWLPAVLVLLLLALAACTESTPGISETDGDTLPPTELTTDTPAESEKDPDTEAPTEEITKDPETTEAPTVAETEAPTEPEEALPDDKDIEVAAPDKLNFSTAVTVTQSGGSATVTHGDGLSYTATGYSSTSDSALTFTKGLTLTFDPADTAEGFNRFVMGYTSTQPLYGTVTYTLNGQSVTDDFYLEAGTDTFSCVISRYLNGKKGTGIVAMTFKTCNGKSADFALCALEVHPCCAVQQVAPQVRHRPEFGSRTSLPTRGRCFQRSYYQPTPPIHPRGADAPPH